MFEHLDDALQPVHPMPDPEYTGVLARTAMMRRRRTVVSTTVVVALLATGGVSGLALGGPESVHAPIGAGPLLALGDPRSTSADRPLPALTVSHHANADDHTNANACPSAADGDRPTAFAAAAVAVAGPVVIPAREAVGASSVPQSASIRLHAVSAGSAAAPVTRSRGGSSGALPHPGGHPQPVHLPPPVGGGGGALVPSGPTATPVPTPTVGSGDGGAQSGDPSPEPTESAGGGDDGIGTGSETPVPTPSDTAPVVVEELAYP
jgi:hypothetical protein